MRNTFFALCSITLLPLLPLLQTGCAQTEYNASPTHEEGESFSDVIQLTHGFEKAGEAYFSSDMQWIIFQAVPKGESLYQMYVAPVMYDTEDHNAPADKVMRATPAAHLKIPRATDIVRIADPIRISPEKSRNTCGWFSTDGQSLLFGSTAGKDRPDEPAGGYQRKGGSYRWDFSPGMEIYRADGWQSAVMSAEPGKTVDLAKHALTNNDAYDAECSFSPDGKWILFSSTRSGDAELYVMRSDGSDVVRLTHTPGYDGGPFFSADGKRIVYRSDRNKNDLLQVFVADLVRDKNGDITGIDDERQLTNDANVNWGPFWHPDGKHIIYATSKHGHHNYELYLMRDDGKLKTRITFKEGPDLLPVFSPDGKYLMWTSRRSSDGTPQVVLAKFKFPKGS